MPGRPQDDAAMDAAGRRRGASRNASPTAGRDRARSRGRNRGSAKRRCTPGEATFSKCNFNDNNISFSNDNVKNVSTRNTRPTERSQCNKTVDTSSTRSPLVPDAGRGYTQPNPFTPTQTEGILKCARTTGYDHQLFLLLLHSAYKGEDGGAAVQPLSNLGEDAWTALTEDLIKANKKGTTKTHHVGLFATQKASILKTFADAHSAPPREPTDATISAALKALSAHAAFAEAISSWRKIIAFCSQGAGRDMLRARLASSSTGHGDSPVMDSPEAYSEDEEGVGPSVGSPRQGRDQDLGAYACDEHSPVPPPSGGTPPDMLAHALAGNHKPPHAILCVGATQAQLSRLALPYAEGGRALPITKDTMVALRANGVLSNDGTPAFLAWNIVVAVVACSAPMPPEAFTYAGPSPWVHPPGSIAFFVRGAVLTTKARPRGTPRFFITGTLIPSGKCNDSLTTFESLHVLAPASFIIMQGHASLQVCKHATADREKGLPTLVAFAHTFNFQGKDAASAAAHLATKGDLRFRSFISSLRHLDPDMPPQITDRPGETETGADVIHSFNRTRRACSVTRSYSGTDAQVARLMLGIDDASTFPANTLLRTPPDAVSAMPNENRRGLALALRALKSGYKTVDGNDAAAVSNMCGSTLVALHLPLPKRFKQLVTAHNEQTRSTSAAFYGPGSKIPMSLFTAQEATTLFLHRFTFVGSDFKSRPPEDFLSSCSFFVGQPVPAGVLSAHTNNLSSPNLGGYGHGRACGLDDILALGSPYASHAAAAMLKAEVAADGLTLTFIEDGTTPFEFEVGPGSGLVRITAAYGSTNSGHALFTPVPLAYIEHIRQARQTCNDAIVAHTQNASNRERALPEFAAQHKAHEAVCHAAREKTSLDTTRCNEHDILAAERHKEASWQRAVVRWRTRALQDPLPLLYMLNDQYNDGCHDFPSRNDARLLPHHHMNRNGTSDRLQPRHSSTARPRDPPSMANYESLLKTRKALQAATQDHRQLAASIYRDYKAISDECFHSPLTSVTAPRSTAWSWVNDDPQRDTALAKEPTLAAFNIARTLTAYTDKVNAAKETTL
jgi:hypothetical protein